MVWLNMPFVPKGASRKLFRPWQGPFRIIKVITDLVYRVERTLPHSVRKQRFVVHFARLKPFHGETATPETPPPQTSTPKTPPSGSSERPGSSPTDDEGEWYTAPHTLGNNHPVVDSSNLRRSSRVSRPPDQYGNLVSY